MHTGLQEFFHRNRACTQRQAKPPAQQSPFSTLPEYNCKHWIQADEGKCSIISINELGFADGHLLWTSSYRGVQDKLTKSFNQEQANSLPPQDNNTSKQQHAISATSPFDSQRVTFPVQQAVGEVLFSLQGASGVGCR